MRFAERALHQHHDPIADEVSHFGWRMACLIVLCEAVIERCGDACERVDECAIEVEDEQRFHLLSMGAVPPFVKDGE
jgi:hypothetical protein